MSRRWKLQAVTSTLVATTITLASAAVAAGTQPMAIGPQVLSVKAGAAENADAYCLDVDSDFPSNTTALTHVAAGDASVCVVGESCISLQDAISKQIVRITGTEGFGVHFENLGSKDLKIEIKNSSVLTDTKRSVSPPVKPLPKKYVQSRQIAEWYERGQLAIDAVEVGAVGASFEVTALIGGMRLESHRGVKEGDLGATIAKLVPNNDGSLMISTKNMDEGRVRAMLADLQVRTGSTRGTAFSEMFFEDLSEDVSIRAGETVAEPSARETHGVFKLEADGREIPAKVIVEFQKKESPSLFAKVGDAIKRVFARFRSKGKQPLVTAATSVRDAVAEEVEALRKTMPGVSPANVWLILGDAARGFYIVKIHVRGQPWAA